MALLMEKSTEELKASLALTPKPYLSVFHMLTNSITLGDVRMSSELLRRGTKMFPAYSLIRNRYAVSLTPRWAVRTAKIPPYALLDKYITDTKNEGVPERIILQLEAIRHDDLGYMLAADGQHHAAMAQYRKALEIGARVGGTFTTEFLNASLTYACSAPKPPATCR